MKTKNEYEAWLNDRNKDVNNLCRAYLKENGRITLADVYTIAYAQLGLPIPIFPREAIENKVGWEFDPDHIEDWCASKKFWKL